jgi:hypothetical protein
MKILHLTLKKKWFEMIASGEKKEEYRELKDYWGKRFTYEMFYKRFFNEYDAVKFRHGYQKDAPTIILECKGVSIKKIGNADWGFEKECFVIKLGKVIKEEIPTKNSRD